MKYIGKANKYYTLWEVYSATHSDYLGRQYKVTVHEYLKNISYSLDTAKEQYPDAPVDESLRGTSTWETPVGAPTSKPMVDQTVFPKGRLAGTKIAECTDLDYLHWALENILYGEGAEIAERVLTDNGWRRLNEYAIVPPDAVADIDRKNEIVKDAVARIERGETLTCNVEYNPNEDHEVVDQQTNIVFNFPEISVQYYRGHEYYLPMLDGKAKRVKGKTIEVVTDHYEVETDPYGWENRLTVYVKSFKIK